MDKDNRNNFDTWAQSHGWETGIRDGDGYWMTGLNHCWNAWNAGIASAAVKEATDNA